MSARVTLVGGVRSVPRETHDDLLSFVAMALAEIGQQREWYWSEELHVYCHDGLPIPRDTLNRARRLACEKLGVAYEWREYEDA